MVGHRIYGANCGRDKNGVFHCVCGKCEPILTADNRDDNGDNRSDSGNGRDYRVDKESSVVGSFL